MQSAGAFLTLMGLLLAALLWGMPQALITAELASAIPVNGGPVVWVERALGPRWGFVNCWVVVFQQVTDIVLYPTLVANYASQLFPALTGIYPYLIKVGVLLVAATLNTVGVENISMSASLLTALIMLPFFLLPCVALAQGQVFNWVAVGPAGIPPTMASNLAVFVSTVLWNMQGWSEVGCIAGEVDGKVFPSGMAIAATLVTAAYSIPVVFGIALSPDTTQWGDGYFLSLASSIAPWLGVLVMVSALLANLSTLLTSMAAYTRTLQASARMGAIPLLGLQGNLTRWRTPVPAIAVYTLTTCALSYNLQFSSLVVYDSAFYLVGQLSVVASFMALKYREPELPRPFSFPGGASGALLATASSVALALLALFLTFSGEAQAGWVVGGVCGGIYALTFLVEFLPCGLPARVASFYQHVKDMGLAAEAKDNEEEEEGWGEEGGGMEGREEGGGGDFDSPLLADPREEEETQYRLRDLRLNQ